MEVKDLPSLHLKPVKHDFKVTQPCPEVEPNVKESCLLVSEDGQPIGLFLREMPKELVNLATIADIEFRSNRVPYAGGSNRQARANGKLSRVTPGTKSAQLGTMGRYNIRKHYNVRVSPAHKHKPSETFIKAMTLLGKKSMELLRLYAPTIYEKHMEALDHGGAVGDTGGVGMPKNWRFATYHSCSNSTRSSSVGFHIDHTNIADTINMIIMKRRNSTGGNLYVPDYNAIFDQVNNSMLAYPSWRNMHAVSPIKATHQKGYRDSHVFFTKKIFYKTDSPEYIASKGILGS